MTPEPPPEFRHDAFLVYAAEDREWAEGYLAPLIAPRERIITPADFRPGDPLLKRIQDSVVQSRLTVLVFSRAFENSPWVQSAQQMAEYLSTEEQARRLVVVNRDGTRLHLSLRMRLAIDCADPDQSAAMLQQLRRDLDHPEQGQESIPCPYPGMKPFSEQSPYFFGREEEVRQLQDMLRTGHRVFVIGPSGSGKSSLVFAGLTPALRAQPHRWRIRTIRPGDGPVERLHTTLEMAATDRFEPAVSAVLAQDPAAEKLLLIVDQLEEIFTLCGDDERTRFVGELNTISKLQTVAVVATHSAGYEGELLALLKSSGRELQPGERMDLGPLSGQELREAIVAPAEKVGVYIDPLLVERIVADSKSQRDESGLLPAVQETMVLLWERRRHRYISSEAFDSIRSGDAQGLSAAMALKADGVLNAMDDKRRQIAMRIFLRLVQFGDDGRNTRRQQSLAAVSITEADSEIFQSALEGLRAASLIVLSGSARLGTQIDISHDALIQRWPRLHEWIEEYRAPELSRRWLQSKVADWVEAGEGRTCLLEKPELARARAWRVKYGVLLGEPPKLDNLIAATQRWKWIRTCVTAAVTLLIVVGSVIAWRVRTLGQAMEAVLRASADPVDSLRTTVDAAKRFGPRPDWLAGMQSALQKLAPDARPIENEIPERMEFSPDKRWLAVSTTDGVTHIWSMGHQGDARDRPGRLAAFGPRNRLVLAGETAVTIVDPNTDAEQTMPVGIGGRTEALEWAAEDLVAAAVRQGDQSRILLWNTANNTITEVARLAAHVNALAVSTDVQWLAAACEDGSVNLWEGPQWQRKEPFKAGEALSDIAFRPRLEEVAVAGRLESPVAIWSVVKHDRPRRRFTGHRGDEALAGVNSVGFDAAGAKLVTSGNDGTVRIWDARNGKPLMTIRVEGQEMHRLVAAVNADSSRVAAGARGMVYFYDASPDTILQKAEALLKKYKPGA